MSNDNEQRGGDDADKRPDDAADKRSGDQEQRAESDGLSAEPDDPEREPKEIERPIGVVALGASAGGLEALEAFFNNMPADTGMAFVVVTHLAPGRVSLMPELLARNTSMPVMRVDHTMRLEPNRVYLAQVGMLSILNGVLHPSDLVEGGPRQLPIDGFFRSLALDQKERAVGIVLSGTGTDGTLGLKEIKGASGMTMVQNEDSARYPGMPHSAIAAVEVDFVLPPEAMARQLVAFASGAARRRRGHSKIVEGGSESTEAFARVFLALRARTGHDFSSYKSTTIRRRIERRMNVHQIERLPDYLRFLQGNPTEIDRLFKELLIGVTSFFRDPEAFDVLEKTLIELLTTKSDHYVVRAWVTGCSTGEEAYSVAILIKEAMEKLKIRFGVQVFGTDLDNEAIDVARAGVFPESITADVTPGRLERYFQKEEGVYRIRKDIREMLVFAPQNLIEDPPFTKLDLLSCRNLLIYLDGKLQHRLLPVFHYALKPGGVLFLGSSETIGTFTSLFEPIDKRWKLFSRKEVAPGSYVADLPGGMQGELATRDLPAPSGLRKVPDIGFTQMAERALLHHLVSPTVIMQERGEIVHIHGRTGEFLEPAPGPQIHANIYNMARDGLNLDLAVAVRHAALANGGVVHHRGIRINRRGATLVVDLAVQRLVHPEPLRGLFMVTFQHVESLPASPPAKAMDESISPEIATRIADLDRELLHIKDVHQSTIEELETANEEMKSTNEELQSTNEELQSANEELETSKEEMQSLNEELQTVNAELQTKLEELSRANDDMKNLLNGTDIATVFLDNRLHIKRFTERAKKVIRIIGSDIGRPIGDLVSNLRYENLTEDAEEVLRRLVFREAEVQSDDGSSYLMRMLPYRTTENVIDGLVMTFVDITKVKAMQEESRRLFTVLSDSTTAAFGQTSELVYEWVFGPLYGRAQGDMIGRMDRDALLPGDAETVTRLKREVLRTGETSRQKLQLVVNGERKLHDLFISPMRDPDKRVVGVSGILTAAAEKGVAFP